MKKIRPRYGGQRTGVEDTPILASDNDSDSFSLEGEGQDEGEPEQTGLSSLDPTISLEFYGLS